MKDLTKRITNLAPNGIPKYVRCYDNGGKTMDRYTIVYTGNYKGRNGCDYFGCNAYPFQGIGIHDTSPTIIDKPSYSHLGKKVKFETLPDDVKTAVMNSYNEMWGLVSSNINDKLVECIDCNELYTPKTKNEPHGCVDEKDI